MKKALLLASLVTVIASSFGITSVDASSNQQSINIAAKCREIKFDLPIGAQYSLTLDRAGVIYSLSQTITNDKKGTRTLIYKERYHCT
ncbi:hypothetical protein EGH10_10680 [Brevibacillus laterosporus]|uniref:Uncharacterized protein n=1 Tax=Brevibacillus laterosporus LMG 15441 TaxID=1042163 RepID=A0A075QXP8_BRELA|nr:hypothetical protein [Brevibacillus laterosporus]AIG25137.1 hypothetical protein BRLA_c007940 [Brevibacillus laterosporus LMG 15441]RJL06582.1 hypothetical protein DM460_21830 [Brevibacillus laterosporus]TPH11765.1 hypothetical protein EGH10_10680 [Brevibacillus laterosporus]